MKLMNILQTERILSDSYPVYYGYCYIVDNNLIKSEIQGTVKDLKNQLHAIEVRNYDMFGREEK